MATIVEQVKSGVVRIETYYGNGTGFIFETTTEGKALILTNHHVIEDAQTITVQVNDADTYPATALGYDAHRDLAVLEICCNDFRPLIMDAPEQVKAGAEVMAIGYPLDIPGSPTVTSGIVSAYRYDDRYKSWLVQTDASVNPGSSGGPLIALNGKVIGINTFVIRGNYGLSAEGLGFAISQQSINETLSDMKQGVRFRFPTPTPTFTPTPTITPTPAQVNWRTYKNNRHDFTIDVPLDWEVNDSYKDIVQFYEPKDLALFELRFPDWYISSAASELNSWLVSRVRDKDPVVFEVLERKTLGGYSTPFYGGMQIAYVRYRYQIKQE